MNDNTELEMQLSCNIRGKENTGKKISFHHLSSCPMIQKPSGWGTMECAQWHCPGYPNSLCYATAKVKGEREE